MRRSGCYAAMVAVFAGAVCVGGLRAQGTPAQESAGEQANPGQGRRGQFQGMGRVAGEITAVNGATLTVKTEDGGTAQVVTTDNTRLMKDRAPVKVGDLHPGDGLMAMGNLDAETKTLHAAMVMATDAAQVKALRENLGKTYISGRVTAIDLDNAKMTVERPDHVSQTIGFDETTSFKRAVRGGGGGGGENGGGAPRGEGRGFGGGIGAGASVSTMPTESITLADIKVGDRVGGTGSLKSGVFVPAQLVDMGAGGDRRPRNNGTPGAGTPSGAGQQPNAGPSGR